MMKREDVPKKHRKLYDKALAGRNQAAAIRSHCLMCMGYEEDPKGCTGRTCPLWPYRETGRKIPRPRSAKPSEDVFDF